MGKFLRKLRTIVVNLVIVLCCSAVSGLVVGANTITINATDAAADTIAPAPSIVSPTGTSIATTSTFTLNAVSGATSYVIWLQNITTNTGVPLYFTADQGGTACTAGSGICTFTPTTPPLVNNNSYGWVAAATNAAGQGPWSSPLYFMVGTLPAPSIVSPTGFSIATTSTFTLNAVAGATGYMIWLQNNTTNTGAPLSFTAAQGGTACAAGSGICTFTPITPPLVNNDSYGWVAAATNPAGQGPWSSPLYFMVGTLPAPSIVSPTGVGIATTSTFTLNAVAGATGYMIWLQNNTTNTGAPLSFTAAQGGTACAAGSGICTFTPPVTPLVNNDSYAWVAAATNAAGQGPWSSPLSFIVATLPAAPTIISPIGTGIATTSNFTLNAVAGATSYVIWLQNNTTNTGVPLYFTAAQGGTACTVGSGICTFTPPVTPLVNNDSYAWVASATNAAGQGPWSSPLSFAIITTSPSDYYYDDLSRLTRVVQGTSGVIYSYDELGNLISTTNATTAGGSPTIMGINPNVLFVGSKMLVTITGQNLLTVDTVTANGGYVSIKDVFATDTRITAELTALTAGTETIKVTTRSGATATIGVTLSSSTLSFSPGQLALAPGTSGALTATISPPISSPLSINLNNHAPSIISTPQEVTIPASGSASFTVNALQLGVATLDAGDPHAVVFVANPFFGNVGDTELCRSAIISVMIDSPFGTSPINASSVSVAVDGPYGATTKPAAPVSVIIDAPMGNSQTVSRGVSVQIQ